MAGAGRGGRAFLCRHVVAGGARRRAARRISAGGPQATAAGLRGGGRRDRAQRRPCRGAARGLRRAFRVQRSSITAAAPEPSFAAARSGFSGRPAVLTAGRLWDEGKNAAALDRVAPGLGAPIRAAGPVQARTGRRSTLPQPGTARRTRPVRHGAARSPAATVFASMARYEPFGLAVLEAAQAGMRLVLSDIPSFRELWDGAAIFVSSDADLLPALQHALATPGDGGARGPGGALHGERHGGRHARRAPGGARAGLMRFTYFTHSLASCWNHGNAHFLRGVLRELVHRGHSVTALEPDGGLEPAEPDCRCRSRSGRSLAGRLSRTQRHPVSARCRSRRPRRRRRRGPRARVERAGLGGPARRAAPRRRTLHLAVPRHAPSRRQRPGGHARLRS